MKWVLCTLALLVVGYVLQLNLLVYAMYVLAGVLCLSRFFTHSWTGKLVARRSCDHDIREIGETSEIEVVVENQGLLAVPWLLLEDALPRESTHLVTDRVQVNGPRLAFTRLGAGESDTLICYEVTFLRRGYYQFGPLLMETGDVFGLHRRFRVAAEPAFVLVLPKVLPLEGYSLASRRPIGSIRVAHRLFEDPSRLAGVRPYQPGDPLNRIHWRAFARSGELHSRLYESSRVAGATLLLDFHISSAQGAVAEASAELAIMAVAAIANAVFLMGQQTGFISNGRDAADRIKEEGYSAEFFTRDDALRRAKPAELNTRLRPVVVPTNKNPDRFRSILETLARLEHSDGLEFAPMIEEIAPRIPRDATVVAVLHVVTPAIADALGGLARSGFLVAVIMVTFEENITPDWAQPPDWADLLLAQGIDFHVVNQEEAIVNLCAQAIVR